MLRVATALILYSVPSGDYLLLPDIAHPVAPLVKVQGARIRPGRRALLRRRLRAPREQARALFPWIHPRATLVPAGAIVPPVSTRRRPSEAELHAMTVSQQIAAAVALRHLGYKVGVHAGGVVVSQLFGDATLPQAPADGRDRQR